MKEYVISIKVPILETDSCVEHCDYIQMANYAFSNGGYDKNFLNGLKVWIGSSEKDKTSIKIKGLYECVLEKLGVKILDCSFGAVLDERVKYDVMLMFSTTIGTSARALEVVVSSKVTEKFLKRATKTTLDRLHLYMPKEYDKGYMSEKLSENLIAGKMVYKEHIDFVNLNKKLFLKCVGNLVEVAEDLKNDKDLRFEPRIAILTALPLEFNMMKLLMMDCRTDMTWEDKKTQYPHGKIGSNDVVLACSGVGNNFSAAIATKILDKYPSIKYTFMVGIAGGIPDLDDPKEHVSLGDVVLSNKQGVLQYDMTKTSLNGIESNFSPRPPDATILRNMEIYVEGKGTNDYTYWKYLDKLMEDKSIIKPVETFLDESKWIENSITKLPEKPKGYNQSRPIVHFGPIASANTVLKNAKIRNQLKKDFKAKAVEMEASGVSDAAWLEGKTYFAVRGICDYANPDKNDDWQDYAAAVAAAFTREIIEKTLSLE